MRVHQEAEKLPKEGFTIQFQFDTDPERRDELVKVMDEVVVVMEQEGPDVDKLQKVKEYLLKQHADNQKENSQVLFNMWQYYLYNVDHEEDYVARVNELSTTMLRDFANQLLGQGNRVEVSMTPR